MTKKEVFDFKPVPRLEQVGDIRSKQVDNHKHCIGCCADSALPRESGRMEFSAITGVEIKFTGLLVVPLVALCDPEWYRVVFVGRVGI